MSDQPTFPEQPQQPAGYPQVPQAPQYYPVQPTKPAGNGFGIAALVLGIVGLVTCFFPFVGLILGALAVVFGILGMRQKDKARGTSIAGLVMGILAVIGGIITLIVSVFVVNAVNEQANKDFKVEYSATADGAASVSYGSLSGNASEEFSGTWTKAETVKGFDGFAVSVSSTDGGTVTCEIVVDGKSVAKQSGTSSVTCSASTLNP